MFRSDGEDSGGSEPSTNRDPGSHPDQYTDEKALNCLESDLQKAAHVVEKPYGCDVCGTRFNFKKTHNRHMRVHNGEKPFGCDVCGESFTGQEILKRCMKVHTGDEQFEGKLYKSGKSEETH